MKVTGSSVIGQLVHVAHKYFIWAIVSLVLLTTLLSPLTTPLILHAVGFLTTGDYSEDLHELASGEAATFLGAWVILPSLLGILSRQLMDERLFVRATPYVKLSNFLILILLNYSNSTLVLPKVVSSPDPDFLFAVIVIVSVLCVAGFGCGFYLGKQIVNRIDATPLSEPARADARGGGELDAVGILILSQARGFCSNIAGLARKLRFIVRRMSAIDRALAHILG